MQYADFCSASALIWGRPVDDYRILHEMDCIENEALQFRNMWRSWFHLVLNMDVQF